MRIGSYMRLVRLDWNLSLREFAKVIDMPHASIVAIERGWLPPSPAIFDRLFRCFHLQQPDADLLYKFFVAQYLREQSFRVSAGAGSFFPLCLAATAALKCFASFIPPEDLLLKLDPRDDKLTHEVRYDLTLSVEKFAAAGTLSEIDFPAKIRILRWLLAQEQSFIRLKDAYRFPLNQPVKRIQKLLDLLPPAVAHGPVSTIRGVIELLKDDIPEYVTDPYISLSLLLLLAYETRFDPIHPGKAVVVLPLPESPEKLIHIEVYSPPLGIAFPGIELGEPYIREYETRTSS